MNSVSKKYSSAKSTITALILGAAIIAPVAYAGHHALTEEEAKAAVEARQANFKSMEKLLKPMIGIARGKSDMDAALVEKNAAEMALLASKLEALYKHDTSSFDIKNRSDSKIWASAEDFAAKSKALLDASTALEAAGKKGDAKGIKVAIMGVGKSCKSCHTEYRTE